MKLSAVILFVALFVTLQAVAAVQLCDTVDKLAVLGNVDGFGKAFTDMSWVATVCSTPTNYNSGWLDVTYSASSVATELYELRVSSLFIRRTLSASVSGGSTMIHLQIEFQADLHSLDYAVNASVQGSVFKDINGLALDSVSYYPLSWKGSMSPNCPVGSMDCTLLYDVDLFDGLPASVLTPTSQPNSVQQAIVDQARKTVSDVNILLGPLTSAPSALHGSIRGSFMVPSQSPTMTTIDGIDTASQNVSVVQFSDACSGTGCGVTLLSSLRDLVTEASQGKCSSLSDITNSFRASINTELVVSDKSIWIHRVTTSSNAMFQCGSLFIGIELKARAAAPSTWPVNVFANDAKAAVSMAKSLPLSLSGNMFGAIKVGTSNFTIISDDLFSIGRGGALVLDRFFVQSTAQTLLTSLFNNIKTGTDLMDNFLFSVLRLDNFATMAAQYTNSVSLPRLVDFLQWLFRDEPRVNLVLASDGSVITLVFSMSEKLPIPIGHTAINTANQVMQDLGNQLMQQFPSISQSIPAITSSDDMSVATFTALFTATVKIGLLSNGNPITPNITDFKADFAGSFDIRPIFPDAQSLITSANFIQVVGQTPYLLAKLPASIEGTAGKVAAFFDKLYVDNAWNASLNFGQAFDTVLTGLGGQSWVMHALQPFSTNFGSIAGDENLRTAFESIGQSITSVSTGSVSLAQQWMDRITQLTDQVPHVFALPVIQPDTVLNQLKVSLDVFELTTLSIPHESMQWKTLGTSRMEIPTIIAKRLNATLDFVNSAATVYNAASKALAKLEDWAVPFRHQMVSGKVGNSHVSIDINLPDITVVDLLVDLIPDRGGDEINVKIFADKLLDSNYYPEFQLLTDNLMAISPSSLLLSLRDVILQSAPLLYTGVLNFPIPPMTQSLGSIYDTIRHDIEDKIVPWLTAAVEDGPMFVLEVCSDKSNDMSLNLTINSIAQFCNLPMASAPTLQDLSDALANGLKQCTLGTFITPQVTKRTSTVCGQISMYAAIPGIVWNLYGSIAGSTTPLQFNPVQEPLFGSWADLSTVFRTLLKMTPIQAEDKNVPIADIQGLLPTELLSVFNDSFPAVFVNLEMPLLGDTQQNLALSPSLSSIDNSLKMILPDGFVKDVDLQTTVGCKLGVVFDVPGTANISAFSDLGQSSGVSLNSTIVDGNNTFDIYVRAQYRSPTDRYYINFNTTVVLTPGLTFQEAFMEETFNQVNATVQDILTIEVDEGSDSLGLPAQIKITLVRKQVDTDAWVLPISLQIANSVVPGLNNFTNEPASAHVVISNFHFDSSLSFSPSLSLPGSAEGVLGVFGLKNSAIKGEASVEISISQIEPYSTLPAVASALITPSTFSQVFEADIDASSNINVFGYDLDIDSLTLPELPSIDFLVNETIRAADASILGDITRRLSSSNLGRHCRKRLDEFDE